MNKSVLQLFYSCSKTREPCNIRSTEEAVSPRADQRESIKSEDTEVLGELRARTK